MRAKSAPTRCICTESAGCYVDVRLEATRERGFAHQTVDIGQFLMSADISGSTCSDFTALLKTLENVLYIEY